jgi:uncharacterized protein (DUF433 family)
MTEAELAELEARARENGNWSSEEVLRLIAEIQRLRDQSERAMITRNPRRCAGDPTVAGTRIAVHDVVSYARHYGGDLERVQKEALPDLSLAELQAAIDYYAEHTAEIEDLLRQRREEYGRSSVHG